MPQGPAGCCLQTLLCQLGPAQGTQGDLAGMGLCAIAQAGSGQAPISFPPQKPIVFCISQTRHHPRRWQRIRRCQSRCTHTLTSQDQRLEAGLQPDL